MDSLLDFLARLKKGNIHFDLFQLRAEALMVLVNVPGEYWEIEFLDDGTVEVELYRSDGVIRDEKALEDLIARHSG